MNGTTPANPLSSSQAAAGSGAALAENELTCPTICVPSGLSGPWPETYSTLPICTAGLYLATGLGGFGSVRCSSWMRTSGFDGMDGVIFALISPLIIKEFALDIPTYRTGFQIWLTLGITGLYFWPWLSDRVGRRSLLAVNIAIFSLMMPIVARFIEKALNDVYSAPLEA